MKRVEIPYETLYELWTIQNKTLLEITEILGVTEWSVRQSKKKHGIVRAYQSKEWMHEHHVVKGLTIKAISNLAHCSTDALSDGMKRLGVPINIYQSNQAKRTYQLNTEFFQTIDNEEKAYWFGFITADGYVAHNHITIGLKRADEHHLQKFLNAIESTHLITRYIADSGSGKGKTHEMSKVTVCSVRLARSLNEKGLKSPKSLQEFLPKLPNELYPHFIRGYFDGDGSFHYHQKEVVGKSKTWRQWKVKVGILGGKRMCDDIQSYFETQGISLCVYQKNNELYEVVGNHLIGYDLLSHIYQNATIYLSRKHEKFLQSPIKR